MEKLRYLSVPDFVWINQELTKSVVGYRFDRLEEGVFTQYAYGKVGEAPVQAAKLLAGFKRMRPFDKGNDACAFVGFLSFLRMNDFDLDLSEGEAAAWFAANTDSAADAQKAMEARLKHTHVHTHHGTPPTREIIGSVIAEYGAALSALLESEAPIPLAV